MKDEIKFNLNEDIIMQIEMASYMEYNSRIASINEHLGEIYGYSDLKDAEEAQLHYEKELAYKAIQNLQEELNKYKFPDCKSEDIEVVRLNLVDMMRKNKRLEQENQILKEINKEQANHLISKENLSYEDYKSRNEKAIEYIKEHTLYSFDLYDKDDVSSYFEKASPKDLLNILQGDDVSENKSNE